MCSIILRIADDGVLIGANRDEMVARAWDVPAAYWPELPGVVAGRDRLAGGTWLGLNGFGVMAAVLNREGHLRESTLGPADGKRSRGELPLLALAERSAADAAARLGEINAAAYRSFNLVVADAAGAFWLRGVEAGRPDVTALEAGVWMITSGEANDLARPRIARHLPKFRAAPGQDWQRLLADDAAPVESALNIPACAGFGTVCSSVIALTKDGVEWQFAAGPPHQAGFEAVELK